MDVNSGNGVTSLFRFSVVLLFLLPSPLLATDLPIGLSRINPAGLAAEWIYEGTAFYALEGPEDASLPVIRLHHPQRGYLLTASEAEASKAEKGGFVRDAIAFYAPTNGPLSIHRFKSSRNGVYVFSATPPPAFIDEGVAFHAYERAPHLTRISHRGGRSR